MDNQQVLQRLNEALRCARNEFGVEAGWECLTDHVYSLILELETEISEPDDGLYQYLGTPH